ncbi:MAG TPA: DUF2911 domain-containing protein [Chitinophagaceae bacterium]
MLSKYFLLCCFLPAFTYGQKQYSDSGYLVYLLGSDTTMAGTYSLKGNDFDIRVVARPNVSITRLNGSLNSKGELQSADGYVYKPGEENKPLVRFKLYVRNDSTFIEQKRGENVTTQRFAGLGMTANGVGVAFRYFLPFWPRYAAKKTGDSIVSGHLTLGTNKKLTITTIAPGKLYAGSTVMGMVTLHLNKNGKLDFIDGIGSSWNVTGKVSRTGEDIDLVAERYAAEEKSGAGLRTINPPDSVSANIDNHMIKIYYSRPEARGRTIFGGVVPYDRFWRTGANAATKIVIDKPLYFGGKELPAGSYSIFTMPGKESWIIMFNSKSNTWGTEYEPAFDVLRVQMMAERSSAFTEKMMIEILPHPGGGEINVLWENTRAWVPFRTEK